MPDENISGGDDLRAYAAKMANALKPPVDMEAAFKKFQTSFGQVIWHGETFPDPDDRVTLIARYAEAPAEVNLKIRSASMDAADMVRRCMVSAGAEIDPSKIVHEAGAPEPWMMNATVAAEHANVLTDVTNALDQTPDSPAIFSIPCWKLADRMAKKIKEDSK